MKKIRTILAHYNGEKFIDEQLESIVNQQIPSDYEHEVFVYDDGSKEESLKYLLNKWSKKVNVISDGKNYQIYKRYLLAFADAIDDGVDFLFLSDQDDIFVQGKYETHLKAHMNNNPYVSSLSKRWFFEESLYKNTTRKTWSGHRTSFDLNFLRKLNFNTAKFRSDVEKFAGTSYSYAYHDMLLGLMMGVLTEPFFIFEKFNDWRVHGSSQTNSGSFNIKSARASSNQYDYYFKHFKIIMLDAFGLKVKISEYNKAFSKFDDHPAAARFKSYLDTFAMKIRSKFLRNIVCDLMDWKSIKKMNKTTKRLNNNK